MILLPTLGRGKNISSLTPTPDSRVWVSRVRRKLGSEPGDPGRIKTFQGIGYLLDVDPPAPKADLVPDGGVDAGSDPGSALIG